MSKEKGYVLIAVLLLATLMGMVLIAHINQVELFVRNTPANKGGSQSTVNRFTQKVKQD